MNTDTLTLEDAKEIVTDALCVIECFYIVEKKELIAKINAAASMDELLKYCGEVSDFVEREINSGYPGCWNEKVDLCLDKMNAL